MNQNRGGRLCLPLALCALMLPVSMLAQETTAGLQGTVKDSSGATIAKATVQVTSPALIGEKKLATDDKGYFRFANLPPGNYMLSVTATGFRPYKQENLNLEVGHLPSLDISLEVGAMTETIEVTSQAAIIDP